MRRFIVSSLIGLGAFALTTGAATAQTDDPDNPTDPVTGFTPYDWYAAPGFVSILNPGYVPAVDPDGFVHGDSIHAGCDGPGFITVGAHPYVNYVTTFQVVAADGHLLVDAESTWHNRIVPMALGTGDEPTTLRYGDQTFDLDPERCEPEPEPVLLAAPPTTVPDVPLVPAPAVGVEAVTLVAAPADTAPEALTAPPTEDAAAVPDVAPEASSEAVSAELPTTGTSSTPWLAAAAAALIAAGAGLVARTRRLAHREA